MHGKVSLLKRPGRRRDERGAVAIMIAVTLTGICVITAMVMDFGLARLDRQIDRSAADAATLAGLHALNKGDGIPHSFAGVCAAVRYLKANDRRFSGINEANGWTDALGAATGNGCASTSLSLKACRPSDKSTWAKWAWSGNSGDLAVDVTIQSGFTFSGASTLPEDALAASSADTADVTQRGCDTLAVTIHQSRQPGLGSLATSSRLNTVVRSVGRVTPSPGDSAPAMLLLKRTGCPALSIASSGAGSGSQIHVFGAITSTGVSMPGTIHADTDGSGCTGGSNSNVFIGSQSDGIVAYAAPMVGNPTSPDPAKPGLITSVAAANALPSNYIRDSLSNVYGSSALSSGGTKNEVSARPLITRKMIDQRYFTAVNGAITAASGVFASGASGPPAGWKKFPASVNACKPTQAQINALNLTVADSMYVDCSGAFIGDSTGTTFNAGRMYFRGFVNPASSTNLLMPNAHHVYLGNHSNNADAMTLGSGGQFQMNTAGNLDALGHCSTGQNASKAVLMVRYGAVKESNNSWLRMCRTTAILMGGSATGCVPSTFGTAPTSTPCPGINSGRGTGHFTQTGGNIDWTAPDSIDTTLDVVTKKPLPAAIPLWEDPNGPEDLALWAESATSSSDKFVMTGGGFFNVRGVFMLPNAEPFTLSGGSALDLTNAQFIATSIELNGGAKITMKVDPNSAVVLPDLDLVGLIR